MPVSFKRSTSIRSFLKCDYCRKRKIKCVPQDRNWDVGEKCKACIAAGDRCGPNQHHAQQLPTTSSSRPPVVGSAVSHDTTSPFDRKWRLPRVATRESTTSPSPPPCAGAHLDGIHESYNFHMGIAPEPDASSPALHKRLQQLGSFSSLYEYLRTRRRVLVDSRPLEMGSMHDQLSGDITDYMKTVVTNFKTICEQTMHAISYTQGSVRELYLLRLETQVDRLLSLCPQHDRFRGIAFPFHAIENIRTEVIHCLIQTYDELHDYPESFHWRQKMQRLSVEYQQRVHADPNELNAFRRLSDQVWVAFNSIKAPPSSASLFLGRENFFPAMHFASAAGYRRATYELAKQHSRQADLIGRLPIHHAAEFCDHELLTQALDHDPTLLEARDLLKSTPLCIAAYIGNVRTVLILCDAKSSLEAYDYLGRDSLIIAAEAGNYDATYALLQRGVDVSSKEAPAPYSALHAAARGGHTEVVELLLDYGASAERQSYEKTPADEALDHGHPELARLIERSATLPSNPIFPWHSPDLPSMVLSPDLPAPWSANETAHSASPLRSQQRKRARIPSSESSSVARRSVSPVLPDQDDHSHAASAHQNASQRSPLLLFFTQDLKLPGPVSVVKNHLSKDPEWEIVLRPED